MSASTLPTRRFLPALTLIVLLTLSATVAAGPAAFRGDLLACLANPNLDLVLILSGILLLYAEANLPGNILPGTLGTLLLMLGIFGLSHFPLRPGAFALLGLGLALLLLALPASVPGLLSNSPALEPAHSRGHPLTAALFVPATAALTLGLATLNSTIHPALALATGIIFATVTLWLGRIAIRARRNKQIPHSRFTTSIPAATPRHFRSVD